MRGLKAEFLVGIFALLVFSVMTFMTFKVGGLNIKQRDGYTLYAYFRDTAGLSEKSKIKIAGVDAGSIEKISLSGGKAKVALRIYPHVEVYKEASAYIRATGLLGDKYLELKPGSEGELLKNGDTIANIQDIVNLDDLISNLTSVSVNLMKLFSELNRAEVVDSLVDTMKNLKDITGSLKESVSENKENLTSIITRIDSITASLDGLMKANSGAITNSLANIDTMTASMKTDAPALIRKLSDLADELKSMVKQSEPAITDTKRMMASIGNITDKVDRGEGSLGKLVNDDGLYKSLTNTVGGLERQLDKIDRLKTYIRFQGDYLTRVKEGKGTFLITLQPHQPDKYYILGIVGDPVGRVTSTTTTIDGVTTIEDKIEKALEFTAQFGKRAGNNAVRIGLTESTFGIGLDHFFLNDKAKISADVWDFSKVEANASNPHLRLGAEYFVMKNLFLTGGYDNVVNSKNGGIFFGAGLSFEDDDFKYVVGAAPSSLPIK